MNRVLCVSVGASGAMAGSYGRLRGVAGDIDQLLESELHGALSLRDDDGSAAFPTPTGSPG
jgi:hypothetical protein